MYMTSLEYAAEQSPGVSGFGAELLSDSHKWEVAWYVRESPEIIAGLPSAVPVCFRAGIFTYEKVLAIPFVIAIGDPTPETVYESWLDAARDKRTLPLLEQQPRIVVHLVGDRRRVERSLRVTNGMRDFAEEARLRIGSRNWTPAKFLAARAACEHAYDSPWELWEAMRRRGT